MCLRGMHPIHWFPGKRTLGMDGHRTGKSRVVETITAAKLGLVTFLSCVHMKTAKGTAKNLFRIIVGSIGPDIDKYGAVVMDNTSANVAAGALVQSKWPWLHVLFCGVHVLDLLIEDIAKIPEV